MSEKPVPGYRTELWMLVDLEPGYEALEIGDRITSTTEWITAEDIPGGVPHSLITKVAGVVEPDPDPRKYGWMRLGRKFSASVWTWTADPGPTLAGGLLLYDRYLWIEGPAREGEAVVLGRATLARPVPSHRSRRVIRTGSHPSTTATTSSAVSRPRPRGHS
ncbi:hypothetical protein [Tomitella biformata]|uniref:hypothetical protein n=1 Tax=Tomitella biformata TaxID=630403 RepID=UPI0004637010|nr:hypothetical protein [Tomitella biformata]